MSSSWVQASKIIDLGKGRWDLALLSFYSLYIIWTAQLGMGSLDMLAAVPLMFFGAGYPLSFLIPLRGGELGKRIFISIAISSLLSVLLTETVDDSMALTILSVIAICSALLEAIRRGAERLLATRKAIAKGAWVWNSYLGMERNRRYAWTVSVTILVILIISVWSIATTPVPTERYTEFYITGPDGRPESIPREITAGTNYSVRLGIVNHEQRTIDYTVQIWLIESSTVDNWTVVKTAYYIHNFTVRLIHIGESQDSEWAPQFETKYVFNMNITGYYKMFFLLSKRGDPVLPTNVTPMQDYAGEEIEELINQARMFEFQSVNINLHISEPQEPVVPMEAVASPRWT